MATKIKTDKVADAITPLVTRVANDEELRAHAKTALDSARTIYSRVQSDGTAQGGGVARTFRTRSRRPRPSSSWQPTS